MNADQRLSELFAALPNFERTRTIQGEWTLDPMTELLAALPVPDQAASARWVQVGGSKGKGTTTHYLAAMAGAAGLRTGVFTSPHLQRVTERIRIDGAEVAAARLVPVAEAILELAASRGRQPSFFELMTLAAVWVFREEAVDLAVFEVGLGGRLDATTAVPVDGAVLTRIELEHTEILGATREAIAAEKAFVIRPDRPAWWSPDPATDPVFAARAAAVVARCEPVADLVDLAVDAAAIAGGLVHGGERLPFTLPGASRFELPALALAYPVLRVLFPAVAVALQPVARPALPGRFEVVARAGRAPLVLDGAHTPASMGEVANELRRRFAGQPVRVLFATAADKQWQDGLREILPLVEHVTATVLPGTPGVAPEPIAEWVVAQGVPARSVADPAAGLADLSDSPAVGLVLGSFYLVGAVRDQLGLG